MPSKDLQLKFRLYNNLPRTSALAQPNVFLSHDFGAIFTEMNAMIRAAISDNI